MQSAVGMSEDQASGSDDAGGNFDEDWGELRYPGESLGLDEMECVIEKDRKHCMDHKASCWAEHRVTLQSNLQLCGIEEEIAKNASFGHGSIDDALIYLGYDELRKARDARRYKPLKWLDSDFWQVTTSWCRLSAFGPSEVQPHHLQYLLRGTAKTAKQQSRELKQRLTAAMRMEHLAQVEFLTAHGAPLPFGEVYSPAVHEAQQCGARRYRINVRLVHSTLYIYFPEVLASLIVRFLRAGKAGQVVPNGHCLCVHCMFKR